MTTTMASPQSDNCTTYTSQIAAVLGHLVFQLILILSWKFHLMMDLRYPISFAMGDKPNDFVFLSECVFASPLLFSFASFLYSCLSLRDGPCRTSLLPSYSSTHPSFTCYLSSFQIKSSLVMIEMCDLLIANTICWVDLFYWGSRRNDQEPKLSLIKVVLLHLLLVRAEWEIRNLQKPACQTIISPRSKRKLCNLCQKGSKLTNYHVLAKPSGHLAFIVVVATNALRRSDPL